VTNEYSRLRIGTAGPLLQSFFAEHLPSHRHASRQTVDGYRDTFRLLLTFLRKATGREPSRLSLADLDVSVLLAFLDHLERERHNSIRSRNVRLAAIRCFFRFVALREPASVHLVTHVLVIPVKRPTQDGRPLRRYQRRWTIERLFAWLQVFRRLVTRYEYHIENFLGMVRLGCMKIMLRYF